MNVRIVEVETGEPADAAIRQESFALPSLQDGWRFNFAKLSKKLKNASTYVLVTQEAPEVVEGCLIFQLIDGILPYGAFIEIAPHNRGDQKKHEGVAGCLIAYAFWLSLEKGKGDYRGHLYFNVEEEKKEDEMKLMINYSVKYGAKRLADTTAMLIDEAEGKQLIKKYLYWDENAENN